MIVLDSSAIVAMLQEEPEASGFFDIVETQDRCVVSAVTIYESAIVMHRRRGPGGVAALMDFIASSKAETRPFTEGMIALAIAAYQAYGKGTGAKAQLNFGDCVSYALAKSLGAPLLYKGGDFAATDLASCR